MSAWARSHSPALSTNFFARSASTPYVRATSSKSPDWKRWKPRLHLVGDLAQRVLEALRLVVVVHAL